MNITLHPRFRDACLFQARPLTLDDPLRALSSVYWQRVSKSPVFPNKQSKPLTAFIEKNWAFKNHSYSCC